MSTQIITTADVSAADFGCRAGKLGVNWDSPNACSSILTCTDASDEGSITYNTLTGELTHTNSNGDTQTVFISLADGFLESVVEDNNAHTLTFTWNTDAGLVPTVIDLSQLVDVYALAVSDTSCIDLSLAGDGSAGNPWTISAAPILDATVTNNVLECNAGGLSVDGDALAPSITIDSTTTCLSVASTGAGSIADPLDVDLTIEVDAGSENALTCLAGGLFVQEQAFAGETDGCIHTAISGTGTSADPFVVAASAVIDPAADNVLECGVNGLLVDVEAWVAAEPFDCSALPTLV